MDIVCYCAVSHVFNWKSCLIHHVWLLCESLLVYVLMPMVKSSQLHLQVVEGVITYIRANLANVGKTSRCQQWQRATPCLWIEKLRIIRNPTENRLIDSSQADELNGPEDGHLLNWRGMLRISRSANFDEKPRKIPISRMRSLGFGQCDITDYRPFFSVGSYHRKGQRHNGIAMA